MVMHGDGDGDGDNDEDDGDDGGDGDGDGDGGGGGDVQFWHSNPHHLQNCSHEELGSTLGSNR